MVGSRPYDIPRASVVIPSVGEGPSVRNWWSISFGERSRERHSNSDAEFAGALGARNVEGRRKLQHTFGVESISPRP